MTASNPVWPVKTRELRNHHMDSTRWNDFSFRDDDIVIATWAKSGTTWMQQIIGQLVFDAAENVPVMEISPWLEMRAFPHQGVIATLDAQDHRRFIKTHLPLDALVFSPGAQYLYVGRDGRDMLWSLYHHHCSCSEEFYELVNGTPGRVGPMFPRPKSDIVEYYHDWLERDGHPFWSFWSHTRGWWSARKLPNVLMVHFNNLKTDLETEMRRIADFLDIEVDESRLSLMVEHCSFEYMKNHAETLSPMLQMVFRGGGHTFVNKGTNGRWRDVLSEEDAAKYERLAVDKLGAECAHWLSTGELPAE